MPMCLRDVSRLLHWMGWNLFQLERYFAHVDDSHNTKKEEVQQQFTDDSKQGFAENAHTVGKE
jgi:hypothetical protein